MLPDLKGKTMSIDILVEGKVLGQKRPLFHDWLIELPPLWERRGNRQKLRDLISHVVSEEVEAFKKRQDERKLARIMSKDQIEQGVAKGKIDPGERDLKQDIDLDNAIGNALQAFEDGLYYVFIDGEQQTSLDSEVHLKTESKVTFIRLVALAGG
jgi:hypothetical protein